MTEAASTLGGIDVLVNNAGISGPTASVEEMAPDAWDAVLAVNLTGTFNVTRLSIPHLKRSEAGVVIIMSSVGGRFGYPERSPYATTKRGPRAVDGDRIHRVLQGRADANGKTLDEVTEDALSIQALKRFVDPADIAALCVSSPPTVPSRSRARPSRSPGAQEPLNEADCRGVLLPAAPALGQALIRTGYGQGAPIVVSTVPIRA
ncbi:short chain dehydrogenase [Sanguibacter gelidistatuariae]|uniref:Short chain dehydrogenase n=1 Tax=Sanguibacter gelidistatuariae TaxID=1814289 RepID=A0A1G6MK82_9MICO|nr:short chain dehydrogenase [Sanguibacter gelidistatuariae]